MYIHKMYDKITIIPKLPIQRAKYFATLRVETCEALRYVIL